MASRKRIIASIGNAKCPLGCTYCFVDSVNYRGLPRADSAESIWTDIDQDVEILQPAADVELFLVPNWLGILTKLARLKRSISFATKYKLSDYKARILGRINAELNKDGAILNVAVSITNMGDSWKEVELRTPSPAERVQTLANLFRNGIPTTVAIRPMLPYLTTADIDTIVDATKEYTHGYLSGPLYLTEEIKSYLRARGCSYETIVKEVAWLPDRPLMEVIESPDLERYLVAKAKRHGLPVFANNVDAVLKLREGS